MPPFNPSPQTAAQIFERFLSARHSLFDIAGEFGTDIVGLCEWANQPEIRRALDAIEAELHARARAAAQAALPLALATLAKLDAEYPHLAPPRRARRAKPLAPTPAPSVPHPITRHTLYTFRIPRPRASPTLPN